MPTVPIQRVTLCLLLAAGCRPEPLAALNDFVVEPGHLELFAVPGMADQRAVTVHSRARFPLHLDWSVPAPFEVSPAAVDLGPGETATVGLRFTPPSAGAFSTVLAASAATGTVLVDLAGHATDACPAPSTCQVARPRPDGACGLTAAADGTACSLPCLGAGTCVAGACVGSAPACDDGDACTVDSCDATNGCVHTPVTCPASSDPCLAPACDPVRGCTLISVDDGTACGPSDCSTSRICLSGVCQTRATPEGSRCGSYSPCQAPGVCRDQQCQRPAPTPLVEAWSYSTDAGTDLDFPGVADADGNLYWWEATTWTASTLVSADRDGHVRYRAPIAFKPQCSAHESDRPGSVLLAASLLLLIEDSAFFDSTQARLEARDKDTGARVWTHDFAPEVKTIDPCPSAGSWEGVLMGPPVDDGASGLYVLVGHWCGSGIWAGNDVFFIDLSTGNALWHEPQTFYGATLVSDEEGNVYFLSAADELTSLDRAGVVRFVRHAPPGVSWTAGGEQMAISGGHLVTPAYEVLELDGGADWPASSEGGPTTVAALAGMSPIIGSDFIGVFTGDAGAMRYAAFDPVAASGTPKWVFAFGPEPIVSAAQPVLTTAGTTLVLYSSPGALKLAEISSDGGALYDCPISASYVLGSPTLRHGRLTVMTPDDLHSLRSFDLPGYEPAAHGWVTACGKMTKEGHPR